MPRPAEIPATAANVPSVEKPPGTERPIAPAVESKEFIASSPAAGDPTLSAASALPSLPAVAAPSNGTDSSEAGPVANPPVAADEDLIEKEWVVRAKKIINDTKDDPYHQEREVSKLQVDYLKKRFDKDLKIPAD